MLPEARRNTTTAIMLLGIVACMVGLAFASVPLYKLFCQVTGYGGTPKIYVLNEDVQASEAFINVRFDANTNAKLPWIFKPKKRVIKVQLGAPKLAFYFAQNLSNQPVTGTATYNVTPFKAAQYFGKIDCFCFSEQTLRPGEQTLMPLEFVIDPKILTDLNTREIKNITISYTFFPVSKKANQIEMDKVAGLHRDKTQL